MAPVPRIVHARATHGLMAGDSRGVITDMPIPVSAGGLLSSPAIPAAVTEASQSAGP